MKLWFFSFLLIVVLFATYNNIVYANIYPTWLIIVNLVAIVLDSFIIGAELQKSK